MTLFVYEIYMEYILIPCKMKSNCILKAFISQGLIIDYISMDFPELPLIENIC